MQDYHRTGIRKAITTSIWVTVAGLVIINGASAESTAPTEAPKTKVEMTVDSGHEAAEKVVEAEQKQMTEGQTCYTDPTGHNPTHAVVKDDGTTIVRTVTADEAWDAAHAGKVWVLSWCE